MIYFQEQLKFLMKYKRKFISLIITFSQKIHLKIKGKGKERKLMKQFGNSPFQLIPYF